MMLSGAAVLAWLTGALLILLAARLVLEPEEVLRRRHLPLAGFALGLAIFGCLGAGFLVSVGKYNFTEFPYSSEGTNMGIIHVLVFAFAFAATTAWLIRIRPAAAISAVAARPLTPVSIGLLTLLPLFGLVVLGQRALAMGPVEYFADRINATSGLGYAVALARLSLVAVVVLLSNKLTGPLGFAVRAIAVVEALTALTLMGSRSDLAFLVLATVIARRLTRPDVAIIDLRTVAVGSVLTVVILALGAARQLLLMGDDSTSVTQYIGEDFTSQVRTAFSESEVPMWLEAHRANWEPELGSTYAAAIVGLVPRRLWPGKPLGAGPRLKNAIRPESYALGGRSRISSYTPGAVGESVLNFGALGPLLAGMAWAALLWLAGGYLARIPAPWGSTLVALGAVLALFAVKAEFFGFLARTFSVLLVPLILHRLTSSKSD